MQKKLYRSITDKQLAGVCGGLAAFLDVDVTLIRLAWALTALFSFGAGVLAYVVWMLIVPEELPMIED